MIKINLRHYYPHYTSDVYIEVPDDIAVELHTFENEDARFECEGAETAHFIRWIVKKDLSGKCCSVSIQLLCIVTTSIQVLHAV